MVFPDVDTMTPEEREHWRRIGQEVVDRSALDLGQRTSRLINLAAERARRERQPWWRRFIGGR